MGFDSDHNGRFQETVEHAATSDPAFAEPCEHVNLIEVNETSVDTCEECIKLGDTWVNLRLCMICGNVGCCNSSKNKHAFKHFKSTGHPIIQSLESFQDWMWCYADEKYVTK